MLAKRLFLLALMALGLIVACATAPEPESESASQPTGTHEFEEVAPGVYFVRGTGQVNVGSNSMVVVNDEDVLVVDSHITPDAARELRASIGRLTDKPITTLVNTHFHYDHAHGNQIFKDAEIIGHEYTRQRLLGDVLSEPTYALQGSPEALAPRVEALEQQVEEAEGEEREDLQRQLTVLRRHVSALMEIQPTPPEQTMTDTLTLERGSRTIQVMHLGRAHTGGDVVVYLPAEKVVFTGDMFYDGWPYLGDSFPREWVDTLERLKDLDAETILGGHGGIVTDKARVSARQEYLRDYWGQVEQAHAAGLSPAEAAAQLDLEEHGFGVRRNLAEMLEIPRMYVRLEGGE